MSLVDNPRISPYLDELLGNDSWRLDHIYFNVLRQAPPAEHTLGGMHGGRSRGGLGTHEYEYRNKYKYKCMYKYKYEYEYENQYEYECKYEYEYKYENQYKYECYSCSYHQQFGHRWYGQ